jgi:hypothetical protein
MIYADNRIGNDEEGKMSKKNGKQIDGTSLERLTASTKGPTKEKINGKKSLKASYQQDALKKTTYHPKERMTVQISKDTIERLKDCVYWNRLTVAQFVEEALEESLKEAEKENGKPFQKRRSELKPGRPIK